MAGAENDGVKSKGSRSKITRRKADQLSENNWEDLLIDG